MINEREIKFRIRYLRKLKNDTQLKSPLRHKLNEQIRVLKNRISYLYEVTPEKAKLIKEIYRIRPELKEIKLDLRKFTIEQLQHHIDKTKEKKHIK